MWRPQKVLGIQGSWQPACFAELEHEVMCVDNDWQKVELLQRGEVPIYEEFLPERLAKHRRGRLRFTRGVGRSVLFAPRHRTNCCYILFFSSHDIAWHYPPWHLEPL